MKKTLVTAAIALFLVGIANATGPDTNGTLQLSGQVDSSIALQITNSVSNPITLASGNTSAAATATISAVSYYGTADNASVGGFVKTHDASNIILTGNFGVLVNEANTSSTAYDLTAALQSEDALAWSLDGTTLSTTASSPLSSTAGYGSAATQVLIIKVPISVAASPTAISNTITLTATAH